MVGSTVILLRNLLRDLGYAQMAPTKIYEDNAFEAFFVDIGAMEPSTARKDWLAFSARISAG